MVELTLITISSFQHSTKQYQLIVLDMIFITLQFVLSSANDLS